jgi:hypothetical protein
MEETLLSLDIYLNIDVDTGGPELHEVNLYWRNITHNVSPMWIEAGVYDALYESNGKQAGEVLDALKAGYFDMITWPLTYQQLDPPNGWGDYEGALEFLRDFMVTCAKHPKAVIRVSR